MLLKIKPCRYTARLFIMHIKIFCRYCFDFFVFCVNVLENQLYMKSAKKIQRIPGDLFEQLTIKSTSKEIRYVPKLGLPGYCLLGAIEYASQGYVIGLHRSQYIATLLLFNSATTAGCSGDTLIFRIDGGKVVKDCFIAELNEYNPAKVALNSDAYLASFLHEVHKAVAAALGKYKNPTPQSVMLSQCHRFSAIKKEGEPHERQGHGILIL
jgi:hypothetical protein